MNTLLRYLANVFHQWKDPLVVENVLIEFRIDDSWVNIEHSDRVVIFTKETVPENGR